MNTLALSLLAACKYLAVRPLRTKPELLLAQVGLYVRVLEPITAEDCVFCGEAAARECAVPLKTFIITHLIEPGDFTDFPGQ